MFESILLLPPKVINYLVGAANLIAPMYGYCIQPNQEGYTCPVSPTLMEYAVWMGVTWLFWIPVLVEQHREFFVPD